MLCHETYPRSTKVKQSLNSCISAIGSEFKHQADHFVLRPRTFASRLICTSAGFIKSATDFLTKILIFLIWVGLGALNDHQILSFQANYFPLKCLSDTCFENILGRLMVIHNKIVISFHWGLEIRGQQDKIRFFP